MLIDGLFNFLNFIVSPSDQPQKFLAFVGIVLLVHVLVAVLDLKWGRGIAFTALALLAAAFYIYYAVVILQVMRQSLDAELAEPQSWASLGVVIGLFYRKGPESPCFQAGDEWPISLDNTHRFKRIILHA